MFIVVVDYAFLALFGNFDVTLEKQRKQSKKFFLIKNRLTLPKLD
jgi:hypothetical protein